MSVYTNKKTHLSLNNRGFRSVLKKYAREDSNPLRSEPKPLNNNHMWYLNIVLGITVSPEMSYMNTFNLQL